MASGKSIELATFTQWMSWRRIEDRPKQQRDRSLNGKTRIKARREARRGNR